MAKPAKALPATINNKAGLAANFAECSGHGYNGTKCNGTAGAGIWLGVVSEDVHQNKLGIFVTANGDVLLFVFRNISNLLEFPILSSSIADSGVQLQY